MKEFTPYYIYSRKLLIIQLELHLFYTLARQRHRNDVFILLDGALEQVRTLGADHLLHLSLKVLAVYYHIVWYAVGLGNL